MRAAELLNWISEGGYYEIVNHGNIPLLIKSKKNSKLNITPKDDAESGSKIKITPKQ